MSIQMLDPLGNVLRSDEQVIQIFPSNTELYGYPDKQNSNWAKGDVIAVTLGYQTKGDGYPSIFWWDSTSTASDDGIAVILPTAFTTPLPGRWLLAFCGCWYYYYNPQGGDFKTAQELRQQRIQKALAKRGIQISK